MFLRVFEGLCCLFSASSRVVHEFLWFLNVFHDFLNVFEPYGTIVSQKSLKIHQNPSKNHQNLQIGVGAGGGAERDDS